MSLGLDQIDPKRIRKEEAEFVPADPTLLQEGAHIFVLNMDSHCDTGDIVSVSVAGAVTYRCGYNKGFHTVHMSRVSIIRAASAKSKDEAQESWQPPKAKGGGRRNNSRRSDSEPTNARESLDVSSPGEGVPAASPLLGLDKLRGKR